VAATAPRRATDHVEETFRAIGRLPGEHDKAKTALQRWVDEMTAIIGQPAAIGVLTIALLLWVTGNLISKWTGHHPWDPIPFSWLQTVATVGALYAAGLILVTQRHADELAARREDLILHLTMLSDEKSARIIQLLEEMRRGDPRPAEVTKIPKP
jgi:uncharacterized membrane protein